MKGSIFQCSTNTENVNKFLMYELLSSFKKKTKQKKQKLLQQATSPVVHVYQSHQTGAFWKELLKTKKPKKNYWKSKAHLCGE